MNMTFEQLWEILNNPQEVDATTFASLLWWMRPPTVKMGNIGEIAVQGKACTSLSETRRKIKEGSLSWNGQKVKDIEMIPIFLWPGWGIIRIGKKQHFMVMKGE